MKNISKNMNKKEQLYLKSSKYGDTFLERNANIETKEKYCIDIWINGKCKHILEIYKKDGFIELIERG